MVSASASSAARSPFSGSLGAEEKRMEAASSGQTQTVWAVSHSVSRT